MEHSYLTRTQVVELTGLHHLTIRRLERKGKFPRRVSSPVIGTREFRPFGRKRVRSIHVGRVKWRKSDVLDWIEQKRVEKKLVGVREKVLQHVMFPGLEWVDGFQMTPEKEPIIAFKSPRGLVFENGTHHWYFSDWEAVWENRDKFAFTQCPSHPFCNTCRNRFR